MRIPSWSWCALLAATVTACGSHQPSAPPATSTPAAASAPAPAQATGQPRGGTACPMDTAGTQITTSDTSDGVAMVFTTTGDVADLRARVRHMADMHNRMAGMHGGGPPGGGPRGHGMGMKMIPSRASVEEVPGGARLVLVPIDPSQLAALRQQVRMHAEMMQSGRCPGCPRCPTPPAPAPGAGSEQPPAGGG